jgi:hypothetical protein
LQAYNGYLQRFGVEHPSSLSACHNVAVILRIQNKLAESECFYRQTLAGQTAYLGARHEDTLLTMHNLAALLQERSIIFIPSYPLIPSPSHPILSPYPILSYPILYHLIPSPSHPIPLSYSIVSHPVPSHHINSFSPLLSSLCPTQIK